MCSLRERKNGMPNDRQRESVSTLASTARKVTGFTLVEVLVALAVLSIGILGVMILFPVSLAQTRHAANISVANNTVLSLTNRYRAEGYDYATRQEPVRHAMPIRHFARSLKLYRLNLAIDLPNDTRQTYVTYLAKQ